MRRLLPGAVLVLSCLAVLALALTPIVSWRFQAPRPLGVLILDKTVPDTSYRGHRGVTWVLNHLRLVHPGSLAPYRATDYVGFVPLRDRAWSVRQFPKALGANRVVYLADTYGVAAADLGVRGSKDDGRHLFGGLSREDLESLEAGTRGGVTLIGEFNMTGEPTSDSVRTRAEALFGFRSTGWSGRRSTDLAINVPTWAVARWEQQAGERWHYTGEGFLLTHRDGRLLVLTDRELTGSGLEIAPTSAGKSLGMRPAPAPDGWFDLVAPANAVVLALYVWQLTPRGDSTVAAARLPPLAAAALAHRSGASRTYYLAGDFANLRRIPGWTELRWGAAAFRLLPAWWIPRQEAFFWRGYVPLLTFILDWSAGGV